MPPTTRPPLPVVIAIALPMLLAVVVASIGITARFAGPDATAPPPADTSPLATPPVDAPDATSPGCTAVLVALDGDLPGGGGDLPGGGGDLPGGGGDLPGGGGDLPGDGDLPSGEGTLPVRALAEPAPDGVRAWASSPRPVVLRCGLPRPQELTPTSALLEIDGVQWLQLDDGVPEPVVVTYVTVDRPVYVVLTAPVDAGSGPLQAVSGVVRNTLPATPVTVR